MFKNVASKFIVFAFDATTNAPKTGDAANITAYVSKDYGGVTVLADTSATEMDATNAPGYYLFDAAQGETNADCITVSAKSSTANIKVIGAPAVIYTRPTTGWLAPATAGRTLVVDANGLADANMVKAGPTGSGTAQTAGDIPALINTLDDLVDTEVAAIKAKTDNLPTDPADASDVAASFATVNTKLDTIDDFLDTEMAAVKAKTDGLPSDPADASDIAAAFATVNTKLDTIDDFMDTELAAVLAAVDTEVGAIKTVTDTLAAATTPPAGVPAANATLLQIAAWLLMLSRNKITQTATTQTVYADDGTTPVAASTVSDDGTTATRGEFA